MGVGTDVAMEPEDRPRHENNDWKLYTQRGGLCALRTVGFKIPFVGLVKANGMERLSQMVLFLLCKQYLA